MAKVSAVLALGGNLGDRAATLSAAIADIGELEGVRARKASPFVESHALTVGGVDDKAPKYLNAVMLIETSLKPKALLSALHQVETNHGRVRLERWGSRTLDIDIITYGSVIRAGKELTIPHPRAYQRGFVLVPWAMIDPDAVLPGHGSVAELAAEHADEVWVAK